MVATVTTSLQNAKTCEPCSFFKHVLWMPNIQVSLENSLRTNNEYNTNSHIHIYTYNKKVYKYTYIHL